MEVFGFMPNFDIKERKGKERRGTLFKCLRSHSSAGALIGDSCKLKLTINVNQVKCWFLRRGETGVPGEKPLENQQTQPTKKSYDAESGN